MTTEQAVWTVGVLIALGVLGALTYARARADRAWSQGWEAGAAQMARYLRRHNGTAPPSLDELARADLVDTIGGDR